jgi:hypothetical protein
MTHGPRRFWQIHLSTAIVLMLVAGGLTGINVEKRQTLVQGEFVQRHMEFAGWPLPDRTFSEWDRNTIYIGHVKTIHQPQNVVMNILIALVVLGVLAVNLEYFIRRRERGRLPAETKQ